MSTAPPLPCDIRAYRSPDDAAATYAVFQAAIRQTASSVYGPGQVEAWAGPAPTDLNDWDRRRGEASTLVAEVDNTVVGFTDLLPDGLVDMLFVHPRSGGRGIARALLTATMYDARSRGFTELRTFASRSAQPTFERLGFTVIADRPDNMVRGVSIPHAEMCRYLS
ncbi:GNAT family N-acetyltransferase [Ruania alba]|uniref:Putative acetyltransferase n=1 Tax=Ruania alba TaxID=648782 RepID=A0A1H5MDF0_9MICO|nr:GNAT family N-acetyltransferase [Ruania alba]SEE87163.1 putative acetyltransferase [Ruania alba]